jgi:hypothetical protein
MVFGTDRAALALIAAGAVLACYFLAREVLGSPTEAALAAGFLAGSPLFLIQSATYLSYLSTVVLLMGFAAALLAGVRLRSGGLLVLSGLLLGFAVFARPFDAFLFAVPFGGWWLWGRRKRGPLRRGLGRGVEAGWLAFGMSIPVGLMLWYFRAATGSPWRLPFTLTDASDTVGFGMRRMFPGQPPTVYTPHLALTGLLRLGTLSSVWVFGGLLLFGLAVAGWHGLGRGRGLGSAATYLGMVALTVPLGYSYFWGSYGSTQWGGPWRFGPFYWLPIVVPLSILGAAGFARLCRADRHLAVGALLAMTAMSALLLVMAIRAHGPFTQHERRLYTAPVAASRLHHAVVFVPPLQGPWLLQPFEMARNVSFNAPVIWAIDRGSSDDLAVMARFPDRAAYRVVAPDLISVSHLERFTIEPLAVPARRGGAGRRF